MLNSTRRCDIYFPSRREHNFWTTWRDSEALSRPTDGVSLVLDHLILLNAWGQSWWYYAALALLLAARTRFLACTRMAFTRGMYYMERGTIYALYDHSEQFGVSPWYWWVDSSTKVISEFTMFSATGGRTFLLLRIKTSSSLLLDVHMVVLPFNIVVYS